MTSLHEAKAVFFDVDDTLYDFERSMRFAFEHVHAKFPDVFAAHKVDDLERAYWRHYRGMPEAQKVGVINTDPARFRHMMWRGALEALAMHGDARRAEGTAATLADAAGLDALAMRVAEEAQRERPRHWREAMYEGAHALLTDLKHLRILGAITNGPPALQRPKLEAIGWRDFFEPHRVFVSGEFGARKPDPSIFLAAAKSAGVEPQECVMVGDAREFDMPSKAVGFRTILFVAHRGRPDVSNDVHPPDAIATSYAEIRKMLLG
ncbi:MAG TPA: HAD family hydrolase [Candidatus Thermoplasmatota archaeon]|nr:HAD family hydrolase [Candidatus Thermoplasmatota archaeon]